MHGLINRTGLFLKPLVFVIVLCFNTVVGQTFGQHPVDDNIRIGLMLSGNPELDLQSHEALFTAQYLIDQINDEGGIDGRRVDIIFKSGDGDWGISSKKSVELIFDYEVSAIIGAMDGQNAHLTQMAITKAEVVYLETRSTDPTLSEINIPWFFRVISNDQQQAELLVDAIFMKRGLKQVAVLYSDRYDHKMAARTFNRHASEAHQYSVQSYEYLQDQIQTDLLNSIMNKDELGGIVFYGSANEFQVLLSEIENNKWQKPIFLPITELYDLQLDKIPLDINYVCVQNSPIAFDPSFVDRYKEEFQKNPGFNAAYMYDGIRLLIESIQTSGEERRELRDRLATTDQYQGLTGTIGFKTNGDIRNLANVCKH